MNREPVVITVEQANVNTATITVKTLTVGRRQVTLAVFRQLPLEDVVNYNANFDGEPWGRVNYCPPKECRDEEHLHVVWQKGDELRRATQYKPDLAALYFRDYRLLLDSWIWEVAVGSRRDLPRMERRGSEKGRWFTPDGLPSMFVTPSGEAHILMFRMRENGNERTNAIARLESIRPGRVLSVDAIEKALRYVGNEYRWTLEAYESLAKLPQLFIAV